MKKNPLFILFFVVFLDLVGFGIVIPILPYYAKEFGASATELGWLMTCYSAMQFLFAPVWGRVSDKVGRRPIIVISVLFSAFAMLILAFAPTFIWLFIGRLLGGVGGANISTASAYIADITKPENRAKGMGLIGAAFGLGFILGPAIGGILSEYSYSTPFLFSAFLAFINTLLAYFKLPEPAIDPENLLDANSKKYIEKRQKNRMKRFDLKTFKFVLQEPKLRHVMLLFFLITVAFTHMEVSFALFMKARHGMDAQGAGWILAFMGFLMVLIQGGLIGPLSRQFGESKLIVIGSFCMAVALFTMAMSETMDLVFIATSFLAIGNGLNHPSLTSLASQNATPEYQGTALGLYQSFGSLARIVGPPLAGYLYDHAGMEVPFLVAGCIMVLACMSTLASQNKLVVTPLSQQRQPHENTP